MQSFERERLRKVQPFLIPSALAAALDAVIGSLRSPMSPRVTIAFAARGLLVLGCDVLDAALQTCWFADRTFFGA